MVLFCQNCNKEFKTKIGLKKHSDKNNCSPTNNNNNINIDIIDNGLAELSI